MSSFYNILFLLYSPTSTYTAILLYPFFHLLQISLSLNFFLVSCGKYKQGITYSIVFSFYLNHFSTYNTQRLFIYSSVVGKSN